MKIRLSATEAARNFSELMNRVHYRGDSFVVERGGRALCEIVPARPARFTGRDLAQLLQRLPRPDKAYLDELEELVKNQPPVAESPWER